MTLKWFPQVSATVHSGHVTSSATRCANRPQNASYQPLTWENSVSEGGLEPPCP